MLQLERSLAHHESPRTRPERLRCLQDQLGRPSDVAGEANFVSRYLEGDVHDFTPGSALVGGVLIGLSASLLLLMSGRVAGISGIVSGLLLRKRGDVVWRVLFVAGLLSAGAVAAWLAPARIGESPRGVLVLAIAGALVGIGTRVSNGCTSGHGVCGLSRFSARSFVATLTFMATGILTVLLVRLLGAGS